jgi:hypothetical protein
MRAVGRGHRPFNRRCECRNRLGDTRQASVLVGNLCQFRRRGGFGTREFVFDSGKWSLIFTHALDRKMTQRTFQFRTGGSYEVGKPSTAVKGAYHGVFNENWKHVTLLSGNPQTIARMGMADCKLTVNLETDISRTGCAAWRPVSECGQDHDLFAMDAKGVYFGVRPRDNNMCTPDKTPTALLPPVNAR